MRAYILPIFLLLSFSACHLANRGSKNTISAGTYEFKNGSLQQDLNIDSVKEDHIKFSYSIDLPNDTGVMIGGNAYYTAATRSPKDKDEKGNDYEVRQYVYENGNCKIMIRISKDPSTMAQVVASNCEGFYNGRSLSSAGVLRRKTE